MYAFDRWCCLSSRFKTSPYSVRLNAFTLVRKVYALAGLESSACEQESSATVSVSGRTVSAACTRSRPIKDAKAGVAALRPASKRLHLPIRAGLVGLFAETRYGFGVLARRRFHAIGIARPTNSLWLNRPRTCLQHPLPSTVSVLVRIGGITRRYAREI